MVNNMAEMQLSPPQMLAIAHAPKVTKPLIRWLLLFGLRLDEVLARTKEPVIAQIRLAWWREMLAKAPDQRPKGEPLLAMLPEDPTLIDAAQKLIDAAELAVAEQHDDATLAKACVICAAYAGWLQSDPETAEKLAFVWAGRGGGQGAATMTPWPRKLRPLSILALSAQLERGDISTGRLGPGIRLSWHALTGR
jgi:15-cis-phytoene synthase